MSAVIAEIRSNGFSLGRLTPDAPLFVRNHDTLSELVTESPLEEAAKEWLVPGEAIHNPTHLDLINTELWLDDLSKRYDRPITISTIPESEIEDLADKVDGVWVMGAFRQSEASRQISLYWSWQQREAYPDLEPERDMRGSPFAIREHAPEPKIANGWKEFDQLTERMHEKGMKVFVDYIPNHVAVDHAWVTDHPSWFIRGSEADYQNAPDTYFKVADINGHDHYIAHGKDPYSIPWSDTAQLNYANPELQEAMKNVLFDLVDHGIDGARCDMAHLAIAEEFAHNWGNKLSGEEWAYLTERDPETGQLVNDFWKKVIPQVKERVKSKAVEKAQGEGKTDEEIAEILDETNFYFIAEAYRDEDKRQLDSTSAESHDGFDFIYGKDFYDNLLRLLPQNRQISPDDLRNHLIWIMEGRKRGEKKYQDVLFIENHDEERAMHTFGLEASRAAAVLEIFTPDTLFLLNQGQDVGRRIRPAMQMRRFPSNEEPNVELKEFYDRNLALQRARIFQEGDARLGGLVQDNPYIFAFRYESPSQKIGQEGKSADVQKMFAMPIVNFSDTYASCLIPEIERGMDVRVLDLITGEEVVNVDMSREGGLYVGLGNWEAQMVFWTPKA
jgi:glycosidase